MVLSCGCCAGPCPKQAITKTTKTIARNAPRRACTIPPFLTAFYVAQPRPLTNSKPGVCPPAAALVQCHHLAQWQSRRKSVAISQELLEILVCPVCKTPVKPTPDHAGLKCQTCRRVYPIRDDIPVMLPEEATVAPE